MHIPKKSISKIRIVGDTAFVTLGNSDQEFKIDAEDAHLVMGFRWSLNGVGYAQSNFNKASHLFHRMVCPGLTKELHVDHINHDRLDNRKVNLRPVTRKGNSNNLSTRVGTRSGYPNVYWHERDQTWKVQTADRVDGVFKNHAHGTFRSLIDACLKAQSVLLNLGRFAPPVPFEVNHAR